MQLLQIPQKELCEGSDLRLQTLHHPIINLILKNLITSCVEFHYGCHSSTVRALAVTLWKPLPNSYTTSPSPAQVSALAMSSLTCCWIKFFIMIIGSGQSEPKCCSTLSSSQTKETPCTNPTDLFPYNLQTKPDIFHLTSWFKTTPS